MRNHNRLVIILSFAGFILKTLFFSACSLYSEKPMPSGLMVDLLTVPEKAVITHPHPCFSWVIEDSRKGAGQTAWQIKIASTAANISQNRPDIWDSGKTLSSRSVCVPYNGPDLLAHQSYWWKVKIWDHNKKPGKWSIPGMFHTGDFSRENLQFPGESRWHELEIDGQTLHVFENKNPVQYHDISPVSVVKNSDGHHFVRFEKAAFGTLRLTLDATEHQDSLVIHLGEKEAYGNRVDRNPGGSITYSRIKLGLSPGRQEYTVELPRQYSMYPNSLVLADHMPEVAAFRFAEIEGWEGELHTHQITQHALLYVFDDQSSFFYSSDENLNRIWDLSKHTLKVTPFLGLYIDGTRERMPYEADAYIQQISHYAVDREFAIQRQTANFLIFNPSWPTEWHLHIVLMAWADYMATGDIRFIETYYDELKKKTLLALAREDGLISTRTGLATEEFLKTIHYSGPSFRDIVDWPQGTPANETVLRSGHGSATFEGETDRYIFADINTVVNAFHYRNLTIMSKISAILGETRDHVFFHERAALVKKSFNEKLFNRETGLYIDGEGVDHSAFHANFFPVAFGLAPVDYYPQLTEFLQSKGMACSPYGAPYLFDALYELGAYDYALELLRSETDRSWMNMLRFGTTITSEAWDIKYKRNMTWNHAWGASPVYIITRKIFGIEALEPGYDKILIKPRPGFLESAEIKNPTIRGPVYAAFHQVPDEAFSLQVTIPANSQAKVILPLPKTETFTLTLNGKKTAFRLDEEGMVIDHLQSGRHIIEWNR